MDKIFLNAQFRHKIVIQKNDTTNWTMQTHEVVDSDIKKPPHESRAWVKVLIVDIQTILDRMASELLQSDTLSKGRDWGDSGWKDARGCWDCKVFERRFFSVKYVCRPTLDFSVATFDLSPFFKKVFAFNDWVVKFLAGLLKKPISIVEYHAERSTEVSLHQVLTATVWCPGSTEKLWSVKESYDHWIMPIFQICKHQVVQTKRQRDENCQTPIPGFTSQKKTGHCC